ncbi:hypothetical protein PUNSTDRAFT_63324 [Punctularia strigosozonata HHB-11173 SS5]|uniref:uncharacterized protein n=1 Tax=Punctularia strigosozonata (strain HHB-11173) TaxID=741275 RepID=UPI00044182C1|nr:uncharacterized protein PUNSTDRAFT_63324 [Punctularia strigosozonata HHB-11173 SS5]EIN11742.1 hypothetical protein PUNSTDRAFT_63324 [Punctularia strigosozonata HHB-11173 SS5]
MHIFSGFFQLYPSGYSSTSVVTVSTHLEGAGAAYNLEGAAKNVGDALIPDTGLDAQVGGKHVLPAIDLSHPGRPGSRFGDTGRAPFQSHPPLDLSQVPLPETRIMQHAPGWTIFENIYMSNGTLFILSEKGRTEFPGISLMTSTGLPAANTPESIQERMPTDRDMDFVTPAQAKERWGGPAGNRVWSVEGNTVLFNDPSQFLDHYYHFCAELLLGMWSFWTGTFKGSKRRLSTMDTPSTAFPPITRTIFAHSEPEGWRDKPGFNSYFFRAAFPSITVETRADWADRIKATQDEDRVWHFPVLLLADRSAAFRGAECGSRTQRTASEALEEVKKNGALVSGWWEPVRRAVLHFGGVEQSVIDLAAPLTIDAEDVVITYVSRQGSRRHLIEKDHDGLVKALEEDLHSRRWELNVIQAERMTREEQLKVVAKTTVMLGVHGNGLTHLILMPPTRLSTVIEIFYPEGFSHDYEWTTRALGMKHLAVWRDKYMTYPNTPSVNYPEGFQGTQIPVVGEAVAKLVEERAEGRL